MSGCKRELFPSPSGVKRAKVSRLCSFIFKNPQKIYQSSFINKIFIFNFILKVAEDVTTQKSPSKKEKEEKAKDKFLSMTADWARSKMEFEKKDREYVRYLVTLSDEFKKN